MRWLSHHHRQGGGGGGLGAGRQVHLHKECPLSNLSLEGQGEHAVPTAISHKRLCHSILQSPLRR